MPTENKKFFESTLGNLTSTNNFEDFLKNKIDFLFKTTNFKVKPTIFRVATGFLDTSSRFSDFNDFTYLIFLKFFLSHIKKIKNEI